MTCRNLPRVRACKDALPGKPVTAYVFAQGAACFLLPLRGCGLPRRFAPRNDSGGGAIAPHVLATADTWQISACHCEPVRTLVRQSASPQGNGASWLLFRQIRYAFRICLKDCFSVLCYRKENGLSRRFAPRNDMQKFAACPRLQGRTTRQARNRLRIRPRCRLLFASSAGMRIATSRGGCPAPRNDRQKSAGRLRLPGSAAGVLPGSVLAPAEILNHSLGQTPTRLRLCPAGSSYGLSSPEASSWRGAGGLWG